MCLEEVRTLWCVFGKKSLSLVNVWTLGASGRVLEDELLGRYFGKAGLLERWSFSVFVMEVTPLRTCSWMSRGKFRKFRRGRRWEAGDVNVLLESDWRTV